MSRVQLTGLFICNLIPYVVGNAVLGLLPIYAETYLNIGPASTGLSLALGFAALSAGTIISGWLSRYFHRHKHFMMLAAPLSGVGVYLVGQAQTMWVLTLALSLSLFMGGVLLTMTSILTGRLADEHHRGRIFGIVGAAVALGQLLSGLGAGPIVEQWGFEALFTVSGLVYVIPLLATLLLREADSDPANEDSAAAKAGTVSLVVVLLLIASTLIHVSNFVTSLGRPVVMSSQGFDPAAITSVMAISGAFNLPLPFVLGWLSDRTGRRSMLFICYIASSVGVAMLVASTELWHFWTSQLLTTMSGASLVVSSALITDVVPARQLSVSLARLSATPWIGGVIGYAAAGAAIQQLGIVLTFTLGALLPVVALALVTAIQPPRLPVVLEQSVSAD